MSPLEITPIPAFRDNYIWMLKRRHDRFAAVVDPGDHAPVAEHFRDAGLELTAILITHHHRDHTGGIETLSRLWPRARVFGPARETIAGISDRLRGGEKVGLPELGMELEVFDVPGHTAGHIAYYGEGALFCGDTIFTAGCGRVFDGTIEQLSDSLGKLSALPDETRMYCAHEYTLDNLGFAKWVEPDNPDLLERERIDGDARRAGRPTVPSSLELEKATNPFLRTQMPVVIKSAENYAGKKLKTRTEVFAALREWKDREYD